MAKNKMERKKNSIQLERELDAKEKRETGRRLLMLLLFRGGLLILISAVDLALLRRRSRRHRALLLVLQNRKDKNPRREATNIGERMDEGAAHAEKCNESRLFVSVSSHLLHSLLVVVFLGGGSGVEVLIVLLVVLGALLKQRHSKGNDGE